MKSTLKAIILPLIVAAFYYSYHQISILSTRVQKLETKLGGPNKVSWNEKATVEKVRRSVVRIIGGESEGSGFAVQKGGFILTNFHVIEFEPSPKVVMPDNTFETAQVVMADKNADLAVVKIEKDLIPLTFADLAKLDPTEEVLAIGFPLGGEIRGESFVGKGSISARRKSKDVGIEYIETSITMIPGMSGGPMVNLGGEVVGVNTAALDTGGLGIAISADSIAQKWQQMATSKDSLKDIQKVTFEPNKNPLEAVRCFYNYLKVRKLEIAFTLLSNNFLKGHNFAYWVQGYTPLLDTTIVMIKPDKKIENRINIKLATKDLAEDGVVYKFFEGYWDVRKINGKWLLWHPRIREVKEPDQEWFMSDKEIEKVDRLKAVIDGGPVPSASMAPKR